MASEDEIATQLLDVGNRLLKPPPSSDELLKKLEDLELILLKLDQSPPKAIQDALLPSMKALISDHVLKNTQSEIKITTAVCLNEITRITAPDSPYDDRRMKEILELIVGSFDKLSLLSGKSYNKALSIIDNVAKVRSYVMMLDLECYELILQMFEQFIKNIRSDHPHSVFLAMEDIMSVIIDEIEEIPLGLLKALLDCVRKENEDASTMSWRLGAKVVERTSQKLRQYILDAIEAGHIKRDDYAPLVSSIIQDGSEVTEQNHVADSAEQVVADEPAVENPDPGAGKSGGSVAKPVLSVETEIKPDTAITPKDKKEKATKKPITSPRGRPKKNASAAGKAKTPSVEATPSKDRETPAVSEEKIREQTPPMSNSSTKKAGRPRKAASGGSSKKVSSSKLETSSSKKEKNGTDGSAKKTLRRKRERVEEEVFETPFGKKKYKEDIVGCKLKVWWPKDKAYYEGRVTSFDPVTLKHRVDYDDGDVEILNLVRERFEFIGDEILNTNRNTGSKSQHSSKKAKEGSPAKKGETPKSGSSDGVEA